MNDKPLTTGEIAEYCHVALRTVLVWIKEGKLKSYNTPGGHNRVSKEEFLSFLTKHQMPIPDELVTPKRQKRILIVDDDAGMVSSIKRAIRLKGNYEIDTALNGFEAGRKIFTFRPDLVILDIRMPGMNGYEVAKQIKQTPESQHMKIIAISAFFETEGKKKILELKADACLDKPFDTKELTALIEKSIGV